MTQIVNVVKATLIFACLCGVSYFSFYKNPQAALPVSDLALENIEALASGESSLTICYGSGTIDCNGAKVETKIIGYGSEF
ncbi:MAG: NVEALA domain-containing protein [Tannerella sp.]|jgi:hypothetical protein|nr:NVEALA domain-containing protein [Tannerella sp.]